MDWLLNIPGPVGILAALAGALLVYITGRRSGKMDAERKREAEKAAEALEVVQTINQTVKETNERIEQNRRLDDDSIRERVRREFRRNG